jgi:hypothetical protein
VAVGWSLPGASDSGGVTKGQKVMIHFVIDHVDIRHVERFSADRVDEERWHVLHPSNDAILAYCQTAEEADMVRKGLNRLAAELNAPKLTLGQRIDRDGAVAVERVTTTARALLDQYRSEDGNGIDQEDAAGLCSAILTLLGEQP